MRNSRWRWLAVALVVALVALPATAATPTLDAATTAGTGNTNSPLVFAHTTGASGTWLTVWTSVRNSENVVSVTFGATNLARRASVNTAACYAELWDGTVAGSTTANVTITWGAHFRNAVAAAVSFNGVVGVGTAVTATISSGTTFSTAVSSLTTDLVVDALCLPANQTGTITVGTGQTVNFTAAQDGAGQVTIAGSREAGSSPTTTMDWSAVSLANGNPTQIAYPLQSVLPPTLPPGLRLLIGVGP